VVLSSEYKAEYKLQDFQSDLSALSKLNAIIISSNGLIHTSESGKRLLPQNQRCTSKFDKVESKKTARTEKTDNIIVYTKHRSSSTYHRSKHTGNTPTVVCTNRFDVLQSLSDAPEAGNASVVVVVSEKPSAYYDSRRSVLNEYRKPKMILPQQPTQSPVTSKMVVDEVYPMVYNSMNCGSGNSMISFTAESVQEILGMRYRKKELNHAFEQLDIDGRATKVKIVGNTSFYRMTEKRNAPIPNNNSKVTYEMMVQDVQSVLTNRILKLGKCAKSFHAFDIQEFDGIRYRKKVLRGILEDLLLTGWLVEGNYGHYTVNC